MDNRQGREEQEKRKSSAFDTVRSIRRTTRWAIRTVKVATSAANPTVWIAGGIFLSLLFVMIFFFPGSTTTGLALEEDQPDIPPGSGDGTIEPTPTPLAIDASSCPIPSGVPSCGSKNVPRSGCGHCNAAYEAAYGACTYDSIPFAIDIPSPEGSSIILPAIDGESIRWTWLDPQTLNNAKNTAIQRYSGLNEETGDQYLIKFHHTAPGSAGGTKYSGETGARICTSPCSYGTGPHVHTEFAKVSSSGPEEWVDAPLYFCN